MSKKQADYADSAKRVVHVMRLWFQKGAVTCNTSS